jgi:type IV secretory pathway TrbF-like protein
VFNLKKRRDTSVDQGAFVVPPGKRLFNDVRAQSEMRARNMTWIASLAIILACIAVGFGIVGYSHPRPVPVAMFIDANGHGHRIPAVSDDANLHDTIVKRQVMAYTKAIFTRTGSMVADRASIKQDVIPLMNPTDPAYVTVNGRFSDPVFNLKTATTLASVAVDVPQKRGPDSWYVKWTVTTLKPDNTVVSVQSYDATPVVKYGDLGAADPDATVTNPTALEIYTFPYQMIAGDSTP